MVDHGDGRDSHEDNLIQPNSISNSQRQYRTANGSNATEALQGNGPSWADRAPMVDQDGAVDTGSLSASLILQQGRPPLNSSNQIKKCRQRTEPISAALAKGRDVVDELADDEQFQRDEEAVNAQSNANDDRSLLHERGGAPGDGQRPLEKISDLLSYEGGPDNLLNHQFIEQSNFMSNNCSDSVSAHVPVDLPPHNAAQNQFKSNQEASQSRRKGRADNRGRPGPHAATNMVKQVDGVIRGQVNLMNTADMNILQQYQQLVGDQHAYQPQINQVSRMLAEEKRQQMSTDEQGHQRSIHERLYKQETMCKKIASQLRKGVTAEKRGRDSASRAPALMKARSVEKMNYSYEQGAAHQRSKGSGLNTSYQQLKSNRSVERARQALSSERRNNYQTVAKKRSMPVQGQIVLEDEPYNPGERLYRRGM